jgi:hypothetical protein
MLKAASRRGAYVMTRKIVRDDQENVRVDGIRISYLCEGFSSCDADCHSDTLQSHGKIRGNQNMTR